MILQRLILSGFKNYAHAEFDFSGNINCFVGNNGVGKTNLLDAIHYLSFCKSFFTSLDIQNIRHGDDFFALHGTYTRNDGSSDLIQCIQKREMRKRFLINKKEYERLSDHIGLFPLVMISPYDRDLINDGSELRRRYIDSVISQFDKIYLDDLILYHKAVAHRNALLKSFVDKGFFEPAALEIWDEQMVAAGGRIHARRFSFIEQMKPLFQEYFEMITGGAEKVDIVYSSQVGPERFEDVLRAALPSDRAAGFSTAGIHKDDLVFLIDGYPVKKFGSQGQQKSFLIAIKLAQFEYTRNIKGFKPILLLDDIFDKLDDFRVAQLLKLVSDDSFGQVFVTDTSPDRILHLFNRISIEHRTFTLPLSHLT